MQLPGSAIGRVFTQPVAPPRRFRRALDTGLTLALGSVCAFALTLGPAPLNTVAVSSAAAASFAGYFEPAPEAALLPADVDDSDAPSRDSGGLDRETSAPGPGDRTEDPFAEAPGTVTAPGAENSPDHSLKPRPPKGPGAHPHTPNPGPPPPHSSKPAPPPHAANPGPPPHASNQGPPPHAAGGPGPAQRVAGSVALTIVETFRTASGLAAFVPADACPQRVVHAAVALTPNGLLPAGQASKTLAPDPAHAAISTGSGPLSVTIYSCQ